MGRLLMFGTRCDRCGHEPANPARSLYHSAMMEQTICVNGAACIKRRERKEAADAAQARVP